VKRGLAGLSPLKRTTFVIGTDRKVIEKITSELRMSLHADKALEALRAAKTAG
jgi:peroxiredoxin Q/BCP